MDVPQGSSAPYLASWLSDKVHGPERTAVGGRRTFVVTHNSDRG